MDSSGAAPLIQRLGLQPHPEGGYFRETYRARQLVDTARGQRAASTGILFLLAAGQWSRWHRIRSDELWHHHGGSALTIYELSPRGEVTLTVLGMNLAANEWPQHGVAAGHWFAAEPANGGSWSLVSCTVAPGFEFVDFELASTGQLDPHAAQLNRLCPHWRHLCGPVEQH